jgi:hypothetical protein
LEVIPYACQLGQGELTPFQGQALLGEFHLQRIRLKQSSDDVSVPCAFIGVSFVRETRSIPMRCVLPSSCDDGDTCHTSSGAKRTQLTLP